MHYVVQPGDSPAKIAIGFAGCPKCAIDLVHANPHKPRVVYPNGFTTFRELAANEVLNLPDKWFDGTLDALPKSYFASLPHADGRTPAAGAVGDILNVSAPLLAIAKNASAAILADPNYCRSVAVVGSPVNAAVHEFKVAWNASQISKVPINTGDYEAPTAAALADVLGSSPAPCTGTILPSSVPSPKKEEGLSTGAIAGIGLLGVGAVAGLLYWMTSEWDERERERHHGRRQLR
jgi:hypothetical protein